LWIVDSVGRLIIGCGREGDIGGRADPAVEKYGSEDANDLGE
jgi:hypothetical protein